MPPPSVFLCLFIYISRILAKDAQVIEASRRLADVDPLLDAIKLEYWEEDEVPCLEGILAVLQGVKNNTLWATWIWDAMQRPTGFMYGSQYQLGSFDQCMKPPWLSSHPHLRTQYCLADVHLTDTDPKKRTDRIDPYSTTGRYFYMTSKHGRYLNVLTWGLCLPSVCLQHSVQKVVQALMSTQHLSPLTPHPYITVDSCQLAGEHVQYSYEFYYFVTLVLVLTVVSSLATSLIQYATVDSLEYHVIRSFDLKRNWLSFTDDKVGEIRSLNSMKFLSTIIVVSVHYGLFVLQVGSLNSLDADKDWDTAMGISLLGIDIILETFFFISGLLLMMGLMLDRRNNPFMGLVRRYVRMLCPLAVMVFYIAVVHKYVGNGPLWPRFSSQEQHVCQKNWWINLLMLPNYIRDREICYIISWYVASDFQLAVVGSLLFYIFAKNRRFGKWFALISIIIAALVPAFVTYFYQLQAGLFYDIQEVMDFSDHKTLFTAHIKSHCRALVYFLGMVFGYFMSVYRPDRYRNIISKKWSIIGAAIALCILLTILIESGLLVHSEYDAFKVSTFVVIRKMFWAIAIGVFIIVFEYGYVPIVNDILWCKPWGALSRLCYVIYVFHMTVVFKHAHSVRSPVTYDFFELVIKGVGVLFSIIPICLYLYLFVEAPASNLASCLVMSYKKQSKNTTAEDETKSGEKPKSI